MFFNSRILGLIIAIITASVTAIYLLFLDVLTLRAVLSVSLTTFFSCFLLVFMILEFIVLREINDLFKIVNKLKKKDFKQYVKKMKANNSTFSKINQEIFNFVSKKEEEIDQLKKLETYRREFLGDISHELKTPIFAAQGFIHTLLDGAINDKNIREKFLRKAAKNLDGLEDLVQDLITLSQIETGEIKMIYENFDIAHLVHEIFDSIDGRSDKKEVILELETNLETPIVYADPFRIRQVLINLIDNAIKYGYDKGKVTVILNKEKEHVYVSVKDDGPGIPPEHLTRIFERFYRVEKSRSKEKGGSGLGLSIVEHIIESHNSKVSVTSKLGKGTTFAFKLKSGTPL